ncbi:hypothetical protein DUNSADRAFT_18259, partial [Dunaliella salina]
MSLQGLVKLELPNIPTLKQVCIRTLQQFVDCIADLGFLDPLSLRDVLCSASQRTLAAVEDGTREGSGRDISWYTWHLWLRHFEYTFGPAQKQVAEASLIPLPGSIPPDYVSPAGVNAPTAHWRRMLERKAAEEAARADAASQRLRNLYGREQELKQSRKTEATSIRPPVKRRRVEPAKASASPRAPPARSASAAQSSGPAQSAGKAKMMQNLGLSRPQQAKPTASGSGGSGSSKGCVKVTHTHRTVKAPPAVPLNKPSPAPRIGSREIVGPPRVHRAGSESSRAKEAVLKAKEEAQNGGNGTKSGLREQPLSQQQHQQQREPLPQAVNLAQQQRMELQRRKQELAQQRQQQQKP